ncbi:hypothetical protein BN77_2458 [Rhizobium mesoamericanum STM3625]|uniref:Uncharacterized protein n=1 Tax=Rhizobium mesoamericanum STM3625 TaxID=1211777 RepID=K0PZ69_9HYPH|nr:hypothetical protein BN77_2458 [Rhizobium mesoamericanum STM3625]
MRAGDLLRYSRCAAKNNKTRICKQTANDRHLGGGPLNVATGFHAQLAQLEVSNLPRRRKRVERRLCVRNNPKDPVRLGNGRDAPGSLPRRISSYALP